MVTVSTIAVALSAQTSQFESGMRKSGTALKDFASTAAAIGGAIGIGAMIGKFGSDVASAFESIPRTAGLAKELGVTTEAFIGLSKAAQKSGLDASEFGSVFEKMEKVVGDAARQADGTDNALTRLGLSAKELIGLSPDAVFGKIADRISVLPDRFAKASAAVDIFGRSGQSLLRTLDQGSAGIAKMTAEAQRLGQSFSAADANAVAKVKGLFSKLWDIPKAAAGQTAILFSRIVEKDIDDLTKLTQRFEASKGIMGPTLPPPPQIAGPNLPGMLNNWKPMAKDAAALFTETRTPLEAFEANIQRVGNMFAAGAIGVDVYGRKIEQLKSAFAAADVGTQLARGLEDQMAAIGTSAKDLDLYKAALAGATQAQQDWIGKLHDQVDAMNQADQKMKEMQGFAEQIFQSTQTPMEKFQTQVEKLQEAFEGGALDPEYFGRGITQANEQLDAALNKMQQLTTMQGPSAKLKGSQEAYSAIDQFQRRSMVDPASKEALKVNQQQLEILRRLAKDVGDEVAGQIGVAKI